jgi:hypothetical protein
MSAFIRVLKQKYFILSVATLLAGGFLGGCSRPVGSPAKPTNDPRSASVPGRPARGALTRAAARGDLREVQNLASLGADLNENLGDTNDQLTPLLAAVLSRQPEVAEWLVQQGASRIPTFGRYDAADFARHLELMDLAERIERDPIL